MNEHDRIKMYTKVELCISILSAGNFCLMNCKGCKLYKENNKCLKDNAFNELITLKGQLE